MDTVFTELIDVFYGGIADDPRIQAPEVFDLTQQFDIWTNPKQLTPFRSMEADEDTSFKISNFVYETDTLIGIGRKSGGNKPKIYTKSPAISGSWTAGTNGEDSNDNSRSNVAGLGYHGYVYGRSSFVIWAWGSVGSPTFTSTAYSAVPACQGLVSDDDLLIFPTRGNTLAVKDGDGSDPTTNWSEPVSFPDQWSLTDVEEFGAFIATAGEPDNASGRLSSKVWLWDRSSADPSHTIDFGEGHLKIIGNIDGTLIGVSQTSTATDEGRIQQKLVIRGYTTGNEATPILEIMADDTTLSIMENSTKFKDGNRLVFGLKITRNGTTYCQLVSIGRKSPKYPWAFSFERLVDNAATVSSIEAAFKLGDTVFVAHNDNGSVNRTNDSAAYTTATYLSNKLNGSSRGPDYARQKKQLMMAGILTKPLTTGQAVSLYYRTDGATAWTLIRTYTYGDDAAASPAIVPANMGFEAGKQNDGNDFINYREVEFKAESTGGAAITGFVYAWKPSGGNLLGNIG